MALPQQKYREIVFLLLYSYDTGNGSEEDLLKLLMKELEVTKKSVSQAQERVHLLLSKKNEIDQRIASASTSYEFDRIQSVERNVLRLGVFELFFDEEIPPKVAISEAMRLARKFSTPESSTFVNAILDALYKKHLGEQIDSTIIAQSTEELLNSEKLSEEAAQTQTLVTEEDE